MKLSHIALRNMRIEAKLSQEEMADRMNIKQPNYNRLESGKVSIKPEHIDKIANALGKTNEEVLSQLIGCNVTSTNDDNAQNNQNFVFYDVNKNVLDEKDVIIETQKQALSALNMTIKILHNKIAELEIRLEVKVAWIKENHLLQTALAHQLDVPSQSKISSWENGNAIPDVLEAQN